MVALLLVVLQFFLWTSVGQTFIAQQASKWASNYLNTEVTIGKVNISFFKFVKVSDIYVADQHQDTLMYLSYIDAGINQINFSDSLVDIKLKNVAIETPKFYLKKYKTDSVVNLRFFLNAFASDDTTVAADFQLSANHIDIKNGMFIWDDRHEPSYPFGMDWRHIDLKNITLNLDNFFVLNDSIHAHFNRFGAEEKCGFILTSLSGDVTYTNQLSLVDNMHIETPLSHVYGKVEYTYNSAYDYANFIDSIYQDYRVDSSYVSFTDISYFAPTLEGMDYMAHISGKVRGPVSDMRATNMHITYGNDTELKGRAFMRGLPDIDNTSFSCKFEKLSTSIQDANTIKTYPFTSGQTLELPTHLATLGKITYKGRYDGFFNDFVTYGTFTTSAGVIKTDIQLSPSDSGHTTYSGKLITKNFDLGAVANQPELLGKTSLNVTINGQDFDFAQMKLKLKGHVSQFELQNYNYSDITLDGGIENQAISGKLVIADTNIDLSFDGVISLNRKIPHYKFEATVNHLRPTQINLAERDSSAVFSSKLLVNFESNSFDYMVGRAQLSDFYFKELDNEVKLKTVDLIGYATGKDKTLGLKSDNIDLEITGQFYFNELFESLKYQTYKWLPSLFSEEIKRPQTIENFEMHLVAKNYSGFSGIFLPQVTFKKDINIDFWFNSEIDSLVILSNASQLNFFNFKAADFEFNGQLSQDTFNITTHANKWLFTDSNYIENFSTNTYLERDWVHSKMTWNNQRKNNNNAGNIQFDLNFQNKENFELRFNNSWTSINDTLWTIQNNSEVNIHGKEIVFNNLNINQGTKGFLIDGAISEDPTKEMQITVDSFNLRFLNPLLSGINLELQGVIDGDTKIKDAYHKLQLFSNNNFLDLDVNNTFFGNGYIKSEWIDAEAYFNLDVNFTEATFKPVSVTGKYYPLRTNNELDLSVNLNHFPIQIIEPFFKEYVSDVKGTLSGDASIKGALFAPQFNGEFNMHHAETKVIYLNETIFLDEQKLFIRPDLIGADAIIVKDAQQRKAEINFSLFHDNFSDLTMDVAITSIDYFRAFNTTAKDNDYFYGNIILSPGSTLGMDTDYEGNLNLTAVAKSGPGSKITIPFFDDDEVEQRDYIYFTKAVEAEENTINKNRKTNKEDEASINLDMSLELTNDAEIQMIFDEFTADKIRATGEGIINMKLDPDGNFNLYGNYVISEGNYLFTFSKVISKNFDIKPNSSITWNGNPYDGIADIKAAYKIRTTLIDLGMVSAYDTNELKKRIPVEVILSIENKYMNPDLNFSFKLPSRYDEIESLLNSLDDGEKNKQVFGLLILNKFMPIVDNTVSSGSGVIATNSTELLSNQLSNWLSTINKDLDVGVRYSPGDNKITTDEVEVALSTQLFNDRMLVETNFGISGTSNTTTTKSNNFVGEFTLSYKVNQKGNIVGKVFNRSNDLNPALVNVAPYTQGVGIAYTEGFKTWNNLGCIISNNFKKGVNKIDCEAEYFAKQQIKQDEYLAKIEKRVVKSREKQKKRKLRQQKRLAKKEEE